MKVHTCLAVAVVLLWMMGDTTLASSSDSAAASVQFLSRIMDRFHDRYPVYDDVSSAGNHFVTFGKIPDTEASVSVNGSWSENPYSGATAIRFEFTDIAGENFGGFYFLNGVLPAGALAPVVNFGEVPSAGFDLTGAVRLRFRARGETGGERIDFFVAGVGRDASTGQAVAPYPGSSPRHPPLGTTFTLSQSWKEFVIDVQSLDLSYVLGGFAWVANDQDNPGGAVFYVDNVEYELSPVAQAARLSQPRFLTSFEMLPLQPDPFDGNPDDDIDLVLRNLAFSYDNALTLLAFLADGSLDSLRRARLLGDAFVNAAAHDRFFDDGRIRTAYAAGDISLPPGWTPNNRSGTVPVSGFFSEERQEFFEVEQGAVDVGNNAWVMIALLALHRRTGETGYLQAARRIGEFLFQFKNVEGTFQGFQGGLEEPETETPVRRPWASTEHNLDIVAAFRIMANLTGEESWRSGAEHAQRFVEAMWDEDLGCYRAGTLDPESRNELTGQLPLDAQPWSLLALPEIRERRERILTCAETHHRNVDETFPGFDFNEDRDGVWFEGTAHMATAYAFSSGENEAMNLRAELERAQSTAPFGDGTGLVSATVEGLTTGFGFKFFRRHHIAVAAWNVFGQSAFNPFYQLTPVIFEDGFESGDPSVWDQVFP